VKSGRSRPVHRATVSSYQLDSDQVLYDPRSGRAYMLNHTGAYVWARCDGARTVAQIAAEVAHDFAIPLSQALADTGDLVDELMRADLVGVC
jgi:hypothetical protein